MPERDEELGPEAHAQTTQEDNEAAVDADISGRVAKLKLAFKLSLAITTIAFSALMALIFAHQERESHTKDVELLVCAFLAFCTLLSGLTLMLVALSLLTLKDPGTRKGQYKAVTILIPTSTVLLILTSVSILIFIPKYYATVPILLLAVAFIVIMLSIAGIWTDQPHNSTGYERYKAELKSCSKLSSSVTTLAFGGVIGTLSGYSKAMPEQTHQPQVKVALFLMFFTSLCGLVSMLISSIPPRFDLQRSRERLVIILKAFIYFLWGFLALTALTAAAALLDAFVFLAFFPALLGVLVWVSIKFSAQDSTGDELELKLVSIVTTSATSIAFAGMMSIFSGFLGSQRHDDLYLNMWMFFLLAAFISGFISMLLILTRLREGSSGIVVKILTCSTIALLALVALGVYCFEVLGA